ncbi:MAG TPA: glycosyltransferase [Verrucomicrobiae bacterium]|nr:glycosyltransferase [Verrucomicrobiae bacterium]
MILSVVGAHGVDRIWQALLVVALFGSLTSTIYLGMTLVAMVRYLRRARPAQHEANATPSSSLPPVTIFKPVHGWEEQLAANLESFFRQDYPDYEVIFGVRDMENPAARIAEQVRGRYPGIPSRIVISGPPVWPNAKVFSLDKMISASSRAYFIVSDSDVRVAPNFLKNTIAPLLNPDVGLVTCMYRGVSSSDFWSRLEALGLSVEMSSGVMVADMMEGMRFALGPAMAVRRDAIDAIGGISAVADYYSDDFELGNRIWAEGYRVVLSHFLVENVLTRRSAARTLGDQLRWMKSTRYSRPAGHAGSGLTYAMPFGILGLLAAGALGQWPLGIGLLLVACLNRMIQSLTVGWWVARDRQAVRYCWLYPLRDLFGFVAWSLSYLSRDFYWRGETYRFGQGGKIAPLQRPEQN